MHGQWRSLNQRSLRSQSRFGPLTSHRHCRFLEHPFIGLQPVDRILDTLLDREFWRPSGIALLASVEIDESIIPDPSPVSPAELQAGREPQLGADPHDRIADSE